MISVVQTQYLTGETEVSLSHGRGRLFVLLLSHLISLAFSLPSKR